MYIIRLLNLIMRLFKYMYTYTHIYMYVLHREPFGKFSVKLNIMLTIYFVGKIFTKSVYILNLSSNMKIKSGRKFIFSLKIYPFYFKRKFRFIRFLRNMTVSKFISWFLPLSFYLICLFPDRDNGNNLKSVTCNRDYRYMRNTCPQYLELYVFSHFLFSVLNHRFF